MASNSDKAGIKVLMDNGATLSIFGRAGEAELLIAINEEDKYLGQTHTATGIIRRDDLKKAVETLEETLKEAE